jgi:phospholipase C
MTRKPSTGGAIVFFTASVLLSAAAWGKKPASGLPRPEKSGIRHIVVVMMENRSFDHFLGWLPGAAGQQAGLTYTDKNGVPHPTYALAPDYQGCSYADPDHSYDGGRAQLDGGLCDGWLRAGTDDLFPIGYYTQGDEAFLGRAAGDWTVLDHYFAPILAPTYPNRIYQHSAVTDRLDDSIFPPSTLPTIWDRLAEEGVRGKYYFSDIPFIALWGAKYASITHTYDEFLADCASGDLPAVSFVDPPFDGESGGTSADDHPHGDIRAGEAFLDRTYEALIASPAWSSTVVVVNFDEWGGFFDHVPPPAAPDVDPAFTQRGFRVPALVVSPWSRRGWVGTGIYDHTSVLKMIEWRFHLRPLSIRDSQANNLAEVLDFSNLNLAAPAYGVPDFTPTPCP